MCENEMQRAAVDKDMMPAEERERGRERERERAKEQKRENGKGRGLKGERRATATNSKRARAPPFTHSGENTAAAQSSAGLAARFAHPCALFTAAKRRRRRLWTPFSLVTDAFLPSQRPFLAFPRLELQWGGQRCSPPHCSSDQRREPFAHGNWHHQSVYG